MFFCYPLWDYCLVVAEAWRITLENSLREISWDYSLIITQAALAISVLTTWHDGLYSHLSRASGVTPSEEEKNGVFWAELLRPDKPVPVSYFIRKIILRCIELYSDSNLYRAKLFTKIIAVGLVIAFLAYCYQSTSSAPLSNQWTYLAWIPFVIWLILFIVSAFLHMGLWATKGFCIIETKALARWNREPIATNFLPGKDFSQKKGKRFWGFLLYVLFLLSLLIFFASEVVPLLVCCVFLLVSMVGRFICKWGWFSRIKKKVDHICGPRPACDLCGRAGGCKKSNCNGCQIRREESAERVVSPSGCVCSNVSRLGANVVSRGDSLTIVVPAPALDSEITITITNSSVSSSS